MRETIINVKGMVCGGCENRIKNALEEIKENAKDITKSNNEDGIVDYLDKKLNRQKYN